MAKPGLILTDRIMRKSAKIDEILVANKGRYTPYISQIYYEMAGLVEQVGGSTRREEAAQRIFTAGLRWLANHGKAPGILRDGNFYWCATDSYKHPDSEVLPFKIGSVIAANAGFIDTAGFLRLLEFGEPTVAVRSKRIELDMMVAAALEINRSRNGSDRSA